MNKNRIHIILGLFLLAATLKAQIPSDLLKEDTTLVKKFKLNFSVPDIPAFKILGTSPSRILRPSTPEDISLIASEFISGTSLVIPKSLSVELAPFLLLKNNLTLREYDNNSILYSLRLSVGAFREKDQTSKLSVGARITLIDLGDLKNDKGYRKKLFQLTSNIVKQKDKYQDEFLKTNNVSQEALLEDPILNSRLEDYISKKIKNTFKDSLETIKKKYKENNWNKQKFDIAAAILGTTLDSLAEKVKLSQFSFWTTYAQPIENWGQLLVGSNYNYIKDTVDYSAFSASARLYGGINRIKGFIETQYEYFGHSNTSNVFVNFGSEIGIFDGIWVNLSAGLEWKNINKENKKSNFIAEFDIRFTLPEQFHL